MTPRAFSSSIVKQRHYLLSIKSSFTFFLNISRSLSHSHLMQKRYTSWLSMNKWKQLKNKVFRSIKDCRLRIFTGKFSLLTVIGNWLNCTFNIFLPTLYRRCRRAFLVNSDLTLRAQLTEFIDHKLIRNKNSDGMDYLLIPLENSTLQEFIEKYKTTM